MKKLFLTVLVIIPFYLFSQERISYKNDKNETIDFEISNQDYYVLFNEANKANIQNTVSEFSLVSDNKALIKGVKYSDSFQTNKNKLKSEFKESIISVEPVLIYKDGIKQVCNSEIIIKLKYNCSLNDLFDRKKYTATKNKFVDNQYLIKFKDLDTYQIFELVNNIKENQCVEFVEPNFTRFLKPHTSDPYFDSQWAIKNQGYLGGISDADMDIDEAWQLVTGQGIKVAVIDEGVDLTHPDLTANLLLGYDATGNNSIGAPNEHNNDAHGTACAGIIAAVANNDTGIAGVAYNANIIPVRIAYSNGYPLGHEKRKWITDNNWIANGIYWAYQNGADILSNSWGGGSPSTTITNSINDAVNNGRNGKGCIVLFSSGNNNSSVGYPATLDKVIAVGASSMCDERKSTTSCDGESW